MSETTVKRRVSGYILVDFDRTLSTYSDYESQGTSLGAPIPAMVERVKRWLASGHEVRVFTARASRHDPEEKEAIHAWCRRYIGEDLKIQNWKDFNCVAIWDDLAVGVEGNTGFRMGTIDEAMDPLDLDEELNILQADLEARDRS
jgi:hypothetical protein